MSLTQLPEKRPLVTTQILDALSVMYMYGVVSTQHIHMLHVFINYTNFILQHHHKPEKRSLLSIIIAR